MINSIAADFRKSIKFDKSDEVTLFRTLAKSIEKHSNSTFIDETHGGNVCNVSFTSVTGNPEVCEIADLLIISENQKFPGSLRATFWQAKKQAVSKWINITAVGSQLDFKGQFNQWDLLSRRPKVNGVAAFNPPSDILASFNSPSIGSFGVFYEKTNKSVEVAHSIAEFIACPNPGSKHPTMSVNGFLDKYSMAYSEAIVRRDLSKFLEALFEFEIGALLDSANVSHRWIIKWVRSKIAAASAPKGLQALDDFLGSDDSVENFDGKSSKGLSVLFVGPLNQVEPVTGSRT